MYIDRGDNATYDFVKADFITDGAWHDLDLSDIVPKCTKAVLLGGLVGGVLLDLTIKFRKKGNIHEINHGQMETLRADLERFRSVTCAVDTNRVLQYNADDEAWSVLKVTVRAWWR